jgi:hypothetical protein
MSTRWKQKCSRPQALPPCPQCTYQFSPSPRVAAPIAATAAAVATAANAAAQRPGAGRRVIGPHGGIGRTAAGYFAVARSPAPARRAGRAGGAGHEMEGGCGGDGLCAKLRRWRPGRRLREAWVTAGAGYSPTPRRTAVLRALSSRERGTFHGPQGCLEDCRAWKSRRCHTRLAQRHGIDVLLVGLVATFLRQKGDNSARLPAVQCGRAPYLRHWRPERHRRRVVSCTQTTWQQSVMVRKPIHVPEQAGPAGWDFSAFLRVFHQ